MIDLRISAICALAGFLSSSLGVTASAANGATPPQFAKKSETICVFEGEWADGEPFRYQGWDTCPKMKITRGDQVKYRSENPRGNDKRLSGRDIPSGAEVIDITNGASTVILFRDATGHTREILIRD